MQLAAAGSPAFLQQAAAVLEQIFGGDMPREDLTLLQVAARAFVVYFAGLVIVRLGKGRMIGRTTSLDIVLVVVLGSLLSRGITGHASLSATGIATAVLVAAHWILASIACHWHGFGNLIKGHCRLLVEDGVMHRRAMLRSEISEHDLLEELRAHGIEDVAEVKRAYKERSGQISVIKRPRPPDIVDIEVRDGVQIVRIKLE